VKVFTTDRRQLAGKEIAVIRHLGIHCGAGGNVVLPYWQREAAASVWRLGLLEVWYRQSPEAGLTGPFYGLNDPGRRLAASLLSARQPRRVKPRGINYGELYVSTR
jgi:hypothetical protein